MDTTAVSLSLFDHKLLSEAMERGGAEGSTSHRGGRF